MERIPEPELMEDEAQAIAYAQADFSEAHSLFIEQFQAHFGSCTDPWQVVDLGCGPADISLRFASVYPTCQIDAIDGADAMIRQGHEAIARNRLGRRIRLLTARLPHAYYPNRPYDVIISNSLLHHLTDPMVLWDAVKKAGKCGTRVFIMDLLRPSEPQRVNELVTHYAAREPDILQSDFRNSLYAAYQPDEVRAQLVKADLDLTVTRISDRHLTASGFLGMGSG